MDLLLDALFGLVSGGGQTPRIDPVVGVTAAVVGLLSGVFLYTAMFDTGGLGLIAWTMIPMTITFIIATALARPHALRGSLLSAGVALILGIPFALVDFGLELWS